MSISLQLKQRTSLDPDLEFSWNSKAIDEFQSVINAPMKCNISTSTQNTGKNWQNFHSKPLETRLKEENMLFEKGKKKYLLDAP